MIPDSAVDEKFNAIANKAVDTNKRWDIAAEKKLNTIDDKTVDIKNKWDVIDSK